jgi:hypothetical protein
LSPDGKYRVQDFSLVYDNHTYHFCSKVCRQIWREDRDMLHVPTLDERLLAGAIQPPNLPGILRYMGFAPDVMGDAASGYAWNEDPRPPSDPASDSRRGERVMTGPQSIPINAKFGEDFVTHLVMITPGDTMAEVAKKVARHSVGKRIAPEDRDMMVYYEDRPVAPDATVTQVGIAPLGHVFVDYVRT